MPIRPGEEWGEDLLEAPDGPIAHDDASVWRHVADGVEPIIRGGDLHRSLGCPESRAPARRLMIDGFVVRDIRTGEVRAHGVAQVVVHRARRGRWMRGRVTVVGNVDTFGRFNLLPRAHPGDGRLDRLDVDAEMSPRQRLYALRRSRLGNHLPHPNLHVSRSDRFEVVVGPADVVIVDHQQIRVSGDIVIEILPDVGAVLI